MYDLRIEPPLDPPEPVVAFSCDWCGCEICDGERYFSADGERLCEECAEEWISNRWEIAVPEEEDGA